MTRFKRLFLALLLSLSAPVAAMAQIAPETAQDRVVGAASAPLTLTVYLSTTCPHCARWHMDVYPLIESKYVERGLLRVVYRDLPTSPQRVAMAGAVIARCAPESRYEDVMTALFRDQSRMRAQGNVDAWLAAGGTAGGLDAGAITTCLANQGNFAEIEAMATQAMYDGIQGTPTFFLNGNRIDADDLEAFDAAAQPLLAGR